MGLEIVKKATLANADAKKESPGAFYAGPPGIPVREFLSLEKSKLLAMLDQQALLSAMVLRIYKATLGRKPHLKYTNLTHSPDVITT